MIYRQTFIVEGRGTFPFDMLRYDHCWPCVEGEMSLMDNSEMIREERYFKEARQVHVARDVDGKSVLPTFGRWSSMGWDVLENTIETRKR
jgi:hypothetical protein